MCRFLATPRQSGLQVTATLAVLSFLALAVACGGANADGGAPLFATGVITEVQADSATAVDSVTLRTDDGETIVFRVDPAAFEDTEEGFFPSHLRAHAVLGEHVNIFYREEDGELFALRLTHG